jgi:hypothetical protein
MGGRGGYLTARSSAATTVDGQQYEIVEIVQPAETVAGATSSGHP